jgi:hypothetical protein
MNRLTIVCPETFPRQALHLANKEGYRMRTTTEEYEFFTPGRVFAILWSTDANDTFHRQIAVPTSLKPMNSERTESQESNTDADKFTVSELFDQVSQQCEIAISGGSGWAWKVTDIALQIHDTSLRLQHWKNSIQGLATDSSWARAQDQGDELDDSTMYSKFLEAVESERPYLSGVVRSYLEGILIIISSMEDLPVGLEEEKT